MAIFLLQSVCLALVAALFPNDGLWGAGRAGLDARCALGGPVTVGPKESSLLECGV